jgi:hypothetical protein
LTAQNGTGSTPVLLAAAYNDIKTLEFFHAFAPVEFKAALTIQDQEGCTPLLRSTVSSNVNEKTVKLLGGEDQNIQNILNQYSNPHYIF